MLHSNLPPNRRPKAQLRATGEVIKKDGTTIPIELIGSPDMTEEELVEQLKEERKQQNKEVK